MAPMKLDLEFKKTDQYKEMAAMVRAIAGSDIPEYFVDLAVAYHMAHPLAYKHHKGSKMDPTPARPERYQVVDGAVTISDPEKIEEDSNKQQHEEPQQEQSLQAAPLLREQDPGVLG